MCVEGGGGGGAGVLNQNGNIIGFFVWLMNLMAVKNDSGFCWTRGKVSEIDTIRDCVKIYYQMSTQNLFPGSRFHNSF